MSRESSPAPAPRDAAGFVCNVQVDYRDLMQRVADEHQFQIEFLAPRAADPVRFRGVYTNVSQNDPKLLLREFFTLLVARSNKKEHRIHEIAKSKKRRPTKHA